MCGTTTPEQTTTASTMTTTPTAPYTGTVPCDTFTSGGNANGDVCVFPFVYQSVTYYKCTVVGRPDGRFWCATTNNYGRARRWGHCEGKFSFNTTVVLDLSLIHI